MVIPVKLTHPEKADDSILVTLSGIVMSAKLLQSLNVVAGIIVIPAGKMIDFRLEQPKKEDLPILETLWGIEMDTRLLQFMKAA